MKKTFKFLLSAAIVAAGFTACSDEVSPIPGTDDGEKPGIVEEGEATFATFNFTVDGVKPASKALNNASGEQVTVPVPDNFRVLIFRADNTLEVDTATYEDAASSNTSLTIPLISGSKKIFVIANEPTAGGNPPLVPAKGPTFNNYSQFNAAYDLMSSAGTEAKIERISMLYGANGDKFIYSNGVDNATQPLKPGVSAPESQQPTNENYIKVDVKRMVAKVAVTKTFPSGPDGNVASGKIISKDSAGVISGVTYKMYNLNRHVYPFQNFNSSGILLTPNSDRTAPFGQYFARAEGSTSSPSDIPVNNAPTAPAVPPASDFYFVTENAPTTIYRGMATCAIVETTFLPTKNHYVGSLGYNESRQEFSPINAGADATGTPNIYLFKNSGQLGLPKGTLFISIDLVRKAIFHIQNPTQPEKANLSDYPSSLDTDIPTYFDVYTNGKAYYRLNIGEQTGSTVSIGIKRNIAYDANITGFLTIGAKDPMDLIEPEDEILEGPTNLTVTINVLSWERAGSNQDI